MARKANWDRPTELYPWIADLTEEEIDKRLRSEPTIMWRILYDIYDLMKVEEDRAAGRVKVGRRPKRSRVSLSDLYETVLPPPYQFKPFPEALRVLMKGDSQRKFAAKVFLGQATLYRLLSGESAPTLEQMEAIARGCNVHPQYFLEWRAQWLGALVTDVLTNEPRMGVTALNALKGALKGG